MEKSTFCRLLHLFALLNALLRAPFPTMAETGRTNFTPSSDTLELYFFETLCTGQAIAGIVPGQDTLLRLFCPGSNGAPDTLKTIEADLLPAPSVRIAGDSILCQGDTARLQVEGFFATYIWSTGAGTRSISAADPGRYAVTVTAGNGCRGEQAVQVLTSHPDAVLDVGPPSCSGSADGFIRAGPFFGGAPPYALSLNGSPFTGDTLFSGLASGIYQLLWRDAGGCADSASITLDEPPPFILDIGPDTTLWPGDSLRLSATVSGPVTRWAWSPSHLFDCDSCTNPQIIRPESTTISLLVENAGGCTATDSKQLFFRAGQLLYVPNAFAPRGQANTSLKIFPGPGNWQLASFEVYNRWGSRLFRSEAPVQYPAFLEWDGKVSGEPAPPGLYAWVAELLLPDGTKRVRMGEVSVVY